MTRRALIVGRDFKPMRGGVAEYAHQVALGLHRQGARVRVLAGQRDGARAGDAASPLEILRIPDDVPGWLPARFRIMWAYGRALRRELRRESPDVVYLPSLYPLALAVPDGVPVVATFHGGEILHHGHRSRLAAWHRRIIRRVAGRAALLLANSGYTRDLLTAVGVPAGKIVVTGCGADAARFRPAADAGALRDEMGLAGRYVVTTVGRLDARKGTDVLLQAVAGLRSTIPELACVVVGDGPMRPGLEAFVTAHGLTDVVRMVPDASDEDVVRHMQAADVFVLPNRITSDGAVEGFGIVFIEAGLCGKPVVGGHCGGAVDAVADGKSGLLVEPTDPNSVAGAIATLHADPARAGRLGQAGRERALSRFTWQTIGDEAAQAILAAGGRA